MAEFSKIAWTDGTFNPWIGCTRVSPGCQNCYAENLMDKRYHRVEWGPGKPRRRTKTWNDPVKWNREAAKTGVRKRVFCASLADWLDPEVPVQWREDLFDLIDACPSLDWLMLTKRPERAGDFLPPAWFMSPRQHVWFGVTAENQEWWDKRVPILQVIPAAVRWVSYEPSVGPLTLNQRSADKVDWVIIGGESDQITPAREFPVEWAVDAVRQCRLLGIVPFVKQIGTNPSINGVPLRVKDKAGADPAEWPESIRVREFPAGSIRA